MEERGEPARGRPIHCRVCTILIGEGYQETRPFTAPDRSGVVCFRCYESLLRRATRRSVDS